MISSDGVLSFKFSPNYEMPTSAITSGELPVRNVYNVVVVASDDALGADDEITVDADQIKMAYKKVTVMVTNVEETETVTLSARQAQVNVELTATYNDLDNEKSDTDLTWKWYLSGSLIPGAGANDTGLTSTYTPVSRGSLRVEASYTRTDGSAKTVSKTVSVRMAPADTNVDPKFGEGAGARSVDENSPPGTRVGNPVAATDPRDILTYTLSGVDEDDYRIDQATGQITVGPRITLDHEEPNDTDMVTVTATDPAGGATPQEVTITINDVNEAPMMSVGFTRNSQPEYNSGDDTGESAITVAKEVDTYEATDVDQAEAVSWSVSGTDADDFDISIGGELTFKEAPNYEMPADSNENNVYMVTVVATDAGVDSKNKMTAERAVVVTIMNVDEVGTVTLSSEQPKIRIPLTATLEDPDGVVADSVKWTWHSDANGTGAAIPMATSDTYTPMETGPLSAKASYTDGHGADKSAVGPEVARAVVDNTANVAPKFPETETGMREVAEGTVAAPEGIGGPVVAMDDNDTGDPTLTYTLSGTDEASFGIVRTSGQLQTKAKLDYETKKSYLVTVTATDSDSASASIDVTIMVTNVDEEPVITLGGLTISGPSMPYYAENRMDAVETYMASGSLAGRARWSLTGEDSGDFILDRDGVLKFKSSPNYEMPRDDDTDNIYKVTVRANAGTYMDTQNVIVTVTNVDELGTLSGNLRPSHMENSEDAVETYAPSGPMADIATWSLEGTDQGYFTITGGMLKFKKSPNFEMPRGQALSATNTNIYEVTVKAEAGGETDKILVTVTVVNVDEDGTVTLMPMRPSVGTEIKATLTDPDLMVTGTTWQWASADARDGDFTNIDGETSDSYIVVEGDVDKFLQATASYTDAEDSGKSAKEVTASAVDRLAVNGLDTVEYPENGTNAVDTYTASGSSTASITWSLSGDDAEDFDISSGGRAHFQHFPRLRGSGRRQHR